MSQALAKRSIIITGAGSGIGRACALELGQRGARLTLVDINEAGLSETHGQLTALPEAPEALVVPADVTCEDAMQRMAQTTEAQFGRIDALIAAAGILRLGNALKTLADTPLEEWNTILQVNLTGVFLANRAVLPAMIRQREGDIVNISSTSGRQGRAFDGPYSASKFGIIGLSESLAEEVAAQNIRVQTILPDAVQTPFWDQNGPGALRAAQMLPPERIAELIGYMLGLPRDTMLINPVIGPFKSRKKKRKSQESE